MRGSSEIWTEIASLRHRLETASGEEAAALRSRLKVVRDEADARDAGVRPDQFRLELAMIEGELREVAADPPRRRWWQVWRPHRPGANAFRYGLIERRDALREKLGLG